MSAGRTNGNGNRAEGTKSPMLLLHGFTGTPVMWDPVLPYLELHHDCHAINLPGHHGGPSFTDPGENIVETFLDHVERQMDDLGLGQAHLVGNSLGGWLALGLASRGRAISTVAISPAAGWAMDSPEVVRAQRLFKALQFQLAYFKPVALELAARPRGRKLAMREAVARPERLPGGLAVQWILAAADTPCWEMLIEHAGRYNIENTVEPFDSPLLIAWGTKDRILPYSRYTVAHKRHLPHAQWVKLDGLGHVPMSDDPALVAKTILDFSTANTSGAVN
jgi:pimeloyl-ACP methyl ester carboxylesterase